MPKAKVKYYIKGLLVINEQEKVFMDHKQVLIIREKPLAFGY